MAIQRAAPMPIPSEESARMRASLAKEYGAEVWEGPERRVLVIRVPRDDPDPVNDVEAAVEHLQPADVEDLTHCLLMGDQRVAQVYVRPLVDLMRERLAFDRRQADHWRQELPGQLSHALFQAQDDPRRRWRLAIRLPCAAVADVEEEHFDDLVEGIGPLLDSPRFKQIVAVYFIAAQDHLRLQANVFLKEMRDKWASEERVRRKAEEERKAQADARLGEEAERRRQETERIALLKEVDRKMARYQAERAIGARPATPRGPAKPEEGPWIAESETTLVAAAREARGPWIPGPANEPPAAYTADALLERAAADGDTPAPTTQALVDIVEQAQPPKHLEDRLEALRARVDSAIDLAPTSRAKPRTARGALTSRRGTTTPRREAATGRIESPRPTGERSSGPASSDPKRRLQDRLEACGFDVITSPPSSGHSLDLAAERPDGEPQRVVARIVPRLDVTTAKQFLKTARELDVDLVLCVTEQVDQEARRLLVATKVKVTSPQDIAAYRF